MKKPSNRTLLIIAGAFLLVIGLSLLASKCEAQNQYAQTVASNMSSAANDTSAVFNIPNGDLSFAILFRDSVAGKKDSVNVSISMDYRYMPSTKWSTYALVSDSTHSDSTGYYKGFVLRRGGTNNIPGATQGRVYIKRMPTGNTGATNPKWWAWLLGD